MPITINLRHLEEHPVQLRGRLPAAELDIESKDTVIRVNKPLVYDIEIEKLDQGLLLQGKLELELDCQCVRCLEPFIHKVRLDPWRCHLALQGEESVPVITDVVDLTPSVREDILLDFPQHPLCNAECGGLPNPAGNTAKSAGAAGQSRSDNSAWAELNKLNLD